MKRFNIRVYGLCVDNDRILISDEVRVGMKMTKFPGGGLEFDEGAEAGLKREFQEELGAKIEVGNIFYLNPFLQISAFNPNDEIIAMYFWVTLTSPPKATFSEQKQDFLSIPGDQQIFRWLKISKLESEEFTFPIDQSLVPKLLAHFSQTGSRIPE